MSDDDEGWPLVWENALHEIGFKVETIEPHDKNTKSHLMLVLSPPRLAEVLMKLGPFAGVEDMEVYSNHLARAILKELPNLYYDPRKGG